MQRAQRKVKNQGEICCTNFLSSFVCCELLWPVLSREFYFFFVCVIVQLLIYSAVCVSVVGNVFVFVF